MILWTAKTFLFGALLISATAHADETIYDVAAAVPCRLVQSGISLVAELKLSALMEDFKGIRLKFIQNLLPTGSGAFRAGIVNFPSRKEIVLSTLIFRQTPGPVREVWLLHDAIEAVGYDDENYQISVGLWWLEKQSPNGRWDFLHSTLMNNFRNLVRSERDRTYQVADGGVTSSGSGGDPWAVQAKMHMMEAASDFRSRYLRAHPTNYLPLDALYQKILTVPLETDYHMSPPSLKPSIGHNGKHQDAIQFPVVAGVDARFAPTALDDALTMLAGGRL